jgi:hypothetical protein
MQKPKQPAGPAMTLGNMRSGRLFGGFIRRWTRLVRRFKRSNARQRNRWRLSIACAALEPPIELSRLGLKGEVCFAHCRLAYFIRSIPSRSTIPASALAPSFPAEIRSPITLAPPWTVHDEDGTGDVARCPRAGAERPPRCNRCAARRTYPTASSRPSTRTTQRVSIQPAANRRRWTVTGSGCLFSSG